MIIEHIPPLMNDIIMHIPLPVVVVPDIIVARHITVPTLRLLVGVEVQDTLEGKVKTSRAYPRMLSLKSLVWAVASPIRDIILDTQPITKAILDLGITAIRVIILEAMSRTSGGCQMLPLLAMKLSYIPNQSHMVNMREGTIGSNHWIIMNNHTLRATRLCQLHHPITRSDLVHRPILLPNNVN